MPRKTALYLLIAVVGVSALLSLALLTRGHVWWDDFASYIMQSQSLLNGSTHEFIQHNTFTVGHSSYLVGPVAYPWGYPALLAPVLAVLGLKVLALKLVNVVFFVAFLFVFFQLARLKLPETWSLGLTAILAFNPALLQAQDLLLSDIPFLFFSTLALWMLETMRSPEVSSPRSEAEIWSAIAAGAVIFAAFELRTNGILLLGALAVAQWSAYRHIDARRHALVLALPYIVFAALNGLHYLFLPGGQESHLGEYANVTLQVLAANLAYYLTLPAQMFASIPLGGVFYSALVLLLLAGLFARPSRNVMLIAYTALTLALYVSWPERQGLRFLYPLLPIFLILAGEGLSVVLGKISAKSRQIAKVAAATAAVGLIGLSFYVSTQLAVLNLQNDREINGPFDPVSQEMFEFIREETPADSVVIFLRPRALRLFTDRDSFLSTSCQDFPSADFVVLHEKEGGNGQVADPEACTNVNLKLVFNNQRFSVFEIDPLAD